MPMQQNLEINNNIKLKRYFHLAIKKLMSLKYFLGQGKNTWFKKIQIKLTKFLENRYLCIKIYEIARAMLIGNCIDLSNYINEDERLKINR